MNLAILSIATLVAGLAPASEEKIKVKDLPQPVLAAVKAKFPEAKVTAAAKEESKGKTIYEVAIEDDDATIDLSVTPKGKIREVEKTIAAAKLPKAVKATLDAKYSKAKIKKAEEVIKYEDDEEEKTFEVVLATEGKDDVEVKLSPKGKILDGEDEEEEDEDGDKEKKGEKKEKDDKPSKKDKEKKDRD